MKLQEILTKVTELSTKNELPEDYIEYARGLLDDFSFAIENNFDEIQNDKMLKERITDNCIKLSKSPLLDSHSSFEVYSGSFFVAFAHWLNKDIEKLCQSTTMYLREEHPRVEGKQMRGYYLIRMVLEFSKKLSYTEWEKFQPHMINSLEEIYPESGAAIYLKALDDSITDSQRLDYYTEVISRNPVFYPALTGIALIFYREKNWKSAISYFRKAIDSMGKLTDADTYFDIAWCYSKVKDYENEIKFYEKCLKADPNFKFAMNNLGYAYQKSKCFENALEWYKKSMEAGLDERYPYRNYFKLLKRLQRYKEAKNFLEKNKKHFPRVYEKELCLLHEEERTASMQEPQFLAADIENEEAEEADEPTVIPEPKRGGKTSEATFTSELRLELEIEERMNKGLPCFDLPLKVYETSDGDYGRQKITPVGRIDILAVHSETNDLYIIELKKGLGDDEVMGQISRYIGWVTHNLANDGQNVYGIICTGQVSDKLKYAAIAVPNVRLCSYSLNFSQIT